ncbi:hypothetical protein L218DRAFT_956033 [Marasmius fiardii PR-910]|nr:hypothetical protein L218DRAFT_956033 [Marasmius fiardii PR-910]
MPLQLHQLETLTKEDFDLYKKQLGTDDENEIKAHIVRIASKAHEIYSYRCIEFFSFARLKTGIYDRIGPSSAYHRALNLCLQQEDAVFLELGTFFGTTLRKAVMEGIPVTRVIGSDIHSQFWDLGHELFGTTPETFPAAFVIGDAFDPAFISGRGPCTESRSADADIPDLQSLTSLVPLHGRISVIHISSVFHLFDEEKQVELAKAISSLLYPRSGSMIFGIQLGQEVAGVRELKHPDNTNRQSQRFLHSPESWKELWDGGVFPTGSVKVEAKLISVEPDRKDGISVLIWSCALL